MSVAGGVQRLRGFPAFFDRWQRKEGGKWRTIRNAPRSGAAASFAAWTHGWRRRTAGVAANSLKRRSVFTWAIWDRGHLRVSLGRTGGNAARDHRGQHQPHQQHSLQVRGRAGHHGAHHRRPLPGYDGGSPRPARVCGGRGKSAPMVRSGSRMPRMSNGSCRMTHGEIDFYLSLHEGRQRCRSAGPSHPLLRHP